MLSDVDHALVEFFRFGVLSGRRVCFGFERHLAHVGLGLYGHDVYC